MAFDAVLCSALAEELDSLLAGGRIEKVYQPEEDALLLHFHRGREKRQLYLSSNSSHARIHLLSERESHPQSPSALCMLLRKHFQGGKLLSVTSVEGERIVRLLVESSSELGFAQQRSIYVEMMGKHSNIIAVDEENGRIIDAVKRVSFDMSRVRQVFPGQAYCLPPSQDKLPLSTLTEEGFRQRLGDDGPLKAKNILSAVQGISPSLAESLITEAMAAEGIPELAEEGTSPGGPAAGSVFAALSALRERLAAKTFVPTVYLDEEDVPLDFHVMPLLQLESAAFPRRFDTISEALDFYYSHKAASNRVRQYASDLSKAVAASLDKHYLKKQRLLEDLADAENSEVYRLYGELLTASLHAVKNGDSSASVLNYYTNETVEIPLDPRFSPGKNAQQFFKKYSKSRTALKEKKLQLEENQSSIDYLESVAMFIENAPSAEVIETLRQELVEAGHLRRRKNGWSPQKQKAKPYSYVSSEGFKLLAGRNNRENDVLTFKTADKKDLWFHTKDIPGSHVILFLEGKEPTEKAIFEAAALAAWHSKARSSENVPVDYVPLRYVKKPAGAKPGMVIFTNNRTVWVDPAEPAAKKEQG